MKRGLLVGPHDPEPETRTNTDRLIKINPTAAEAPSTPCPADGIRRSRRVQLCY